ncbi:hypothetical protein [Novosphingobium sp.]|jgi:hypothetical protein|uniref:hypothetical protein n=1 Tax=Novosphingobium sp. TaxID=1874826 RepID=UPI0032252BAD
MSEDRSSRALARIEQALARIEAASRRPATVSDDAELADLRARHDQLRSAVEESLQQLDQLIESTQG